MQLPKLNDIHKSKEYIENFLGYNHNPKIADNEFYDTCNLSSSFYPVLSVRGKRGTFDTGTDFKALISNKYLCAVDGENFVVYKPGSEKIEIDMDLTDTPKTLISMGAYVIIFPDKKYINITSVTNIETISEVETGSIEHTYTNEYAAGTPETYYYEAHGVGHYTKPLIIKLCTSEGESYDNIVLSSSVPSSPNNNSYWLDNSISPNVLKRWDEASSMWVEIPNTHIKIQATDIGKGFKVGDTVKISGLKDNDIYIATGGTLPDSGGIDNIGGYYSIDGCEDDYIVIPEMCVSDAHTIINAITIERTMPDMDFVIEAGNRLWGCKYGYNEEHEFVNEIYASKLGDFKNWHSFEGISTDSYTVSLGSNEQFTGAINYLGYPIFFKQGFLHKIYGNMPSNYQVQSVVCEGVQNACADSMVIANNILYYKSVSGICKYDGTMPENISYKLGSDKYNNASAGVLGDKIYFSMNRQTNNGIEHSVIVYDTLTEIWHKESTDSFVSFCTHSSTSDLKGVNLYYISGRNKIKVINGENVDDTDTDRVEWYCESGDLVSSTADRKFISRLTIRADLSINSTFNVLIKYNNATSNNDWITIYSTTNGNDTVSSVTIPIIPRRCDNFKLRFSGRGDVKIFSIAKTIEKGSEYSSYSF